MMGNEAVFVLTNDRQQMTDMQTNSFTPLVHAHGVNISFATETKALNYKPSVQYAIVGRMIICAVVLIRILIRLHAW